MRSYLLIVLLVTVGCSERPSNAKIDKEKKEKTDFAALAPQTKEIDSKAIEAFRRGQVSERNGDFDKAIGEYTEAIRLHTTLSHAFNNRGMCWLGNGDLDKAIKDLSEAIRIDPKASSVPYINRGNIWRKKKDFEKALADFSTAIDVGPNRFEAWEARAQLLCENQDFQKGIKDFDEVIKLKPTYHQALFDRGLAWHRLKEFDKAIADYTEAIRIEPRRDSYLNERGRAWHMKKDYAKATADFTQAIQLNEWSIYYKNRGAAWHDMKEYKKSIDDFEEALRSKADDADVTAVLARLLSTVQDEKLRDGKRALTLANAFHKLEPKSVDGLEILASASAEVGDFDAAVAWQQKAIQHPELKDKTGAAIRLSLYKNKQPYRQDRLIVVGVFAN